MTEDVSPDADLRSLGGRKLLFSETDQAIYEIDELTAFVWQSLRSGMSPDAIACELAAAGVEEASAKHTVNQATDQLRTISTRQARAPASPDIKPSNPAPPLDRLSVLTVRIPGASAIEVHLSDDLLPEATRNLGYLCSDVSGGDCRIVARTLGDTIEFYPPDKAMWHSSPADFITTLKADILEQVLRCAEYEVALHTAALVRNGKALLIAGPPGAGKSTLSLALTRSGWELAADDVALVNSSGRIIGLPFPLTAKSSSWPMIDEYWPELAEYPSYHRPDGFDVRYIMPESLAAPGPWEIGAFVILDRHANGSAELDEIDPVRMLEFLISEATSRDRQLTRAGFTALVTAIEGADCAKLTYSDLFDGVNALEEFCR